MSVNHTTKTIHHHHHHHHRMHYPKADAGRLYILRNEGGREMMQLEPQDINYQQHKYLTTTADQMLQLILAHDKKKLTL